MDLPVWSALPFVLLLLCVAVLPLVKEHWWHKNQNKAIVAFLLAAPTAAYLVWLGHDTTHALIHELEDYGSFMAMLTALYVISGGIAFGGRLVCRSRTNLAILAIGAVLANFVGTTGASMLLIRPILRANRGRAHVTHLPVFFIFIVSNTGGLLTPLGDPPLFLGFLQGVDFFWTLQLWPEWVIVNGCVLSIFYLYDRYQFSREVNLHVPEVFETPELQSSHGWKLNGPLLLGVVAAVLSTKYLPKPTGEGIMVLLTLISILFTPKSVRAANKFSWGPIIEVAVIFAGIFTTMVPALILLKIHGKTLPLSEPWHYFWVTGGLSSFLDNAPTYLTIGTQAAGGEKLSTLVDTKPDILAAISCGAVFMGANTYIGNGPNFMVKAIAEEEGYPMPSFFGYMVYSGLILVPLYFIVTFVFFRG
jgi:Na+/H+ antiporter NhaD/arsenite permease-like protein